MGKKDKGDKKEMRISKSSIILGVILLLLFIGSFIFFSFWFMPNKVDDKENTTTEEVAKDELINLALGEEFIINLSSDTGKRYLKTNIVVAYDKKNKEFTKSQEDKVIVLRDAVINYLKLRTVEETKDTEKIKGELIDSLNKAVNEDVIKDVYFQSLIVQ